MCFHGIIVLLDIKNLAPKKPLLPIQLFCIVACLMVTIIPFVGASQTSANAHIKLTDGINPSSSASDSGWVVFNKDSLNLPLTSNSANTNFQFLGTGEFKDSLSKELEVEALMRAAGTDSSRLDIYLNVFDEPDGSAPYWNWNWFDTYPDGARILRAVNSGYMVDVIVNKFPQWSNKSLPLEHPPEKMVVEEVVTLNSTTPAQLSHKFLMGEKNYAYDKESVVAQYSATQSVTNEWVGSGTGGGWQELNLDNGAVVPNSLKLYVNGVLWNEVTYFRGSNTLDKQAYVFFPNTGRIRFGDGWSGPKLPSGASVTATYSYYTNRYREYSGTTYNTTEQLDYRIDYANGTIKRTSSSSIPSGSKVKITYYYLDTSWWQTFWKELTAHYAGKVAYFEPSNEENLDKFWYGTQAQYVEMLRTASIGLNQGNPNAKLVLGGLGWSTDYLSKTYALGAKDYFDIAAWHPYGWQTGLDTPGSHANLLNGYYFGSMSANSDSSKPVFLNEVGFSTSTQVGVSWEKQGIELSRMYMILRRNPQVENMSWWGVVDDYPVGQLENELYISHMGLIAKDNYGNLTPKPSYYTFKNFGTNKGMIIDLAAYNSNGSLANEAFTINKIVFTSLRDDISSANVLTSWKNTNDWQNVSETKTTRVNAQGVYEYTLTFSSTSTRFVQLQLVKKSTVSDFAIGEVQVFSTAGANVALGKYYAVEGFKSGQIELNPPSESNPLPYFDYTINQTSGTVNLTNKTNWGTADVTGYLWFVNDKQVSNSINYNHPTTENVTLNICLRAYYNGGESGYVQIYCKSVNTGTWQNQASNPAPFFDFTINPSTRKIDLVNTTDWGSASVTGYLWFVNGTQASNLINTSYSINPRQNLNICLYAYYTGGVSGYVQSVCRSIYTGNWWQ